MNTRTMLVKSTLLIIVMMMSLFCSGQDTSKPYVTFKYPDTFPTRIVIPEIGIKFDIYKTEQTARNYQTFLHLDQCEKKVNTLEKEREDYIEAHLALMQKLNYVNYSHDSISQEMYLRLKDLNDEIDYQDKRYSLMSSDLNLCLSSLAKERKKSLWSRVASFGWGPFKLKYIVPVVAGAYIGTKL